VKGPPKVAITVLMESRNYWYLPPEIGHAKKIGTRFTGGGGSYPRKILKSYAWSSWLMYVNHLILLVVRW